MRTLQRLLFGIGSCWGMTGDVPPDVEFWGSGGSLAGLRIGRAKQPSPEGDKEPPCQGNQRSQ